MTTKKVQYEFKVIVQVSEDAWPSELRDHIHFTLDESKIWIEWGREEWIHVQSVEQVRDYT